MKITSYTDDIREHWDWILPMLKRCDQHQIEPIDYITMKDDIEKRKALVIVISDDEKPLVASVVELNHNSIHVRLMAGEDMEQWLELMDTALVQLAQIMKVKHITQLGRVGWSRSMKKLGWRHQLSQYSRAV